MNTQGTTPGNQQKLAKLHAMLVELLEEITNRGFYGNAGVELAVQDGTIQHIRCKVERVVR